VTHPETAMNTMGDSRLPNYLFSLWMAISAVAFLFGCVAPQTELTETTGRSDAVTIRSTLAHELLRLEAADGQSLDECRRFLDVLLSAIQTELKRSFASGSLREKAQQFFTTVDKVLVKHNVIYPPKSAVTLLSEALTPRKLSHPEVELALQHPDNLRRHSQIRRTAFRRGDFFVADCDTSALIYLAAAELAGYPCDLVEVPGHSFLRWSSQRESFNWDPNSGESRSDDSYRIGSQLPEKMKDCFPYLKPMSREEVMGYWMTISGKQCVKKMNYRGASGRFEEGCRLAPRSFYAAHERAWFLATCPDPTFRNGRLAVELLAPVIECWPEPNFIDTFAAAHAEAGDFSRALEWEKRAYESSRTWRKSGFVQDRWPSFELMIEIYSRRMTYAQFFAAPH
jgi:hypothetical protein